jgi:hypothetical protein
MSTVGTLSLSLRNCGSSKKKLGLAEVEYVRHMISATGISFKEEKQQKVLKKQKRLKVSVVGYAKNRLQFSGWLTTFEIMCLI